MYASNRFDTDHAPLYHATTGLIAQWCEQKMREQVIKLHGQCPDGLPVVYNPDSTLEFTRVYFYQVSDKFFLSVDIFQHIFTLELRAPKRSTFTSLEQTRAFYENGIENLCELATEFTNMLIVDGRRNITAFINHSWMQMQTYANTNRDDSAISSSIFPQATRLMRMYIDNRQAIKDRNSWI